MAYGCVYFIKCEQYMKIGYTTKDDPSKRLYSMRTGNPFDLELWGYFQITKDPRELVKKHPKSYRSWVNETRTPALVVEDSLHKFFEEYHHKDEWYEAEPIIEFMGHFIKDCNMIAQCDGKFITEVKQ